MRALASMPALIVSAALVASIPAGAADGGGIAGYVVDGISGRPVASQRVQYYRLPYDERSVAVADVRTDARGYFGDITLAPGRYVLVVDGADRSGCTIEDVLGGEVSRVRIRLERDANSCSGPRSNPSLVDANATADVYRI